MSPAATPAPHGLAWRPMTALDVPAVRAMELAACAEPLHAWTDDNYRSSLASGYWMRVALTPDGRCVAVCVVLFGVDELHLLNIAVDRDWHGQGVARWILGELVALARAHAQQAIWLEVRPSNTRARGLYRACGYADVGVRRQYYPASTGREDAIVMKCEVTP